MSWAAGSIITLSSSAGGFALNACDEHGAPFVQSWRPGAPICTGQQSPHITVPGARARSSTLPRDSLSNST
jgi:hypothetical protein